MFPVLVTNRLLLNQIENTDAESVLFLRSDEEAMRYIKRQPYQNIGQAYDFIQLLRERHEAKSAITWAIRIKENPGLIGSICLWKISWEHKTAEVGYDLKPSYHGQGIMSEALTVVVVYGFTQLRLHLIEAFTSRHNEASKGLLLKHGFVLNPDRTDEDNADNLIFELRSPALPQED